MLYFDSVFVDMMGSRQKNHHDYLLEITIDSYNEDGKITGHYWNFEKRKEIILSNCHYLCLTINEGFIFFNNQADFIDYIEEEPIEIPIKRCYLLKTNIKYGTISHGSMRMGFVIFINFMNQA